LATLAVVAAAVVLAHTATSAIRGLHKLASSGGSSRRVRPAWVGHLHAFVSPDGYARDWGFTVLFAMALAALALGVLRVGSRPDARTFAMLVGAWIGTILSVAIEHRTHDGVEEMKGGSSSPDDPADAREGARRRLFVHGPTAVAAAAAALGLFRPAD
jgi:hypothetical protein